MKKGLINEAAADAFVQKMATPPQQDTAAAEDAPKPKRRRRAATEPKDTKHNGAGEERVTLFVDAVALEKLRTIAWANRRKFKDVVADAMRDYVGAYEKQHGEVMTR